VLDTNVLLIDADSIFHFEDNDILIPLKVLEEIDRKKRQMDSVGANARKFARTLDEFREVGSLQTGVSC
jgi:PhoH-like ATPase